MEGLSDEALMLHYQASADSDSFEQLFKRYESKVYGYLRARVRDQAMCDDILQSTFLKLHRFKHRYNAKYPFAAWLFTICRNSMIDHLRKQATHSYSQLDTMEGPIDTSEPPMSNESPEFLNELPDRYKQAVSLRYVSDWSFDEIARELGTTSENARKLISRGIQKLKVVLKKMEAS